MKPAINRTKHETPIQRVLVAGATGYLGGFVAQELKARGHFVRALARSPEKLGGIRGSLDEAVKAEVTRPETLAQVCNGIDVVFSSVGITRQKDGMTFSDVDYQGNKNLLAAAIRAGVKKFVYVSVLNGPNLRHLDIVGAHEDFVDELRGSGIEYAVLRPTGYFSDMGEMLEMARRGRVWLIGSGKSRVNPIHGADLAVGPELDLAVDVEAADQPVFVHDVGHLAGQPVHGMVRGRNEVFGVKVEQAVHGGGVKHQRPTRPQLDQPRRRRGAGGVEHRRDDQSHGPAGPGADSQASRLRGSHDPHPDTGG